jgi:hypothetical protein
MNRGDHIKKFGLALSIVFLLLLSPNITFAADALYRMLHADEVKQFQEDQDAIIVGQLLEHQPNSFKVKVIKVISGKVSSDTILLSDDFTYGWDKRTPSINDFAVFSLKKTGSTYKKAWGIFEATSGDYKTLTLKSHNAPSPGLLGDLAAIQWYVNTGGTEKDFSFSNSTAFVKRPNGQLVQIYPVLNRGENAELYENALKEIANVPSANDTMNSTRSSKAFDTKVLILIGFVASGAVLLIKLLQKGRKK